MLLVLENDVSYMTLARLHHSIPITPQCSASTLIRGDNVDSQGVNDTRNVAQYREKDVDQEVGIAATFEENAKRWQEDGEDDFADVAVIHE